MIAADEIHDHQARCRRHLRTLAMLARDEDDRPPTAAEVGRVTGEIFAEAEASARVALAAADDAHPGTWTLLLARLNRLAAAAAEAVAAARDGDTAALRRHVRRLETVAAAIWTVQHAVCGPAPEPRPAPDDMLLPGARDAARARFARRRPSLRATAVAARRLPGGGLLRGGAGGRDHHPGHVVDRRAGR